MTSARKIKFRAWDINNKVIDEVCDISFGKDLYIHCSNNNGNESENFILMQFTDFFDKDGIEIYEGDIVKNKNEVYEVVFESGMFCLGNLEFPIWKANPGNYWEIIGNIYEHKHLME